MPMPPCICRASLVTRIRASEHRALAFDTWSCASSAPSSSARAAAMTVERDSSISMNIFAARCLSAWNVPIRTPNWLRDLRYSIVRSKASVITPSISPQTATVARSTARPSGSRPPPTAPRTAAPAT